MPISFQESLSEPIMEKQTTEIQIQYFAVLREQRGRSDETLQTSAATPEQLYQELQERHGFHLPVEQLQVAINQNFSSMSNPLKNKDHVVFIPPVAGG